jgi:hypothetical protein
MKILKRNILLKEIYILMMKTNQFNIRVSFLPKEIELMILRTSIVKIADINEDVSSPLLS